MKNIQRVHKLLLLLLFGISIIHSTQAQTCTGTLGKAINETSFGQGAANPGPRLPAATINNISYVTTTCPNDGQYTIANLTENCFITNGVHTWQTVKDHTGNTNGYFMLVNANNTPSDFYIDTVKNLCPNTTYEFAAWILNMLSTGSCSPNPIYPNIEFTIETPQKIILGSYRTGDIPMNVLGNAQWVQYGFIFRNVASTEVVLRMHNFAPGGCGNDFALDDITFKPCGPNVNIAINGNNRTFIDTCLGKAVTLQANISAGYTIPEYQWQDSVAGRGWANIPNATADNYPVSQVATGTYYYRMFVAETDNINSNCRISSEVVTVVFTPVTIPTFDPIVICSNSSPAPVLTTTSKNGILGTWSPSQVSTVSTAIYTFTPTSSCSEEFHLTVNVTESPNVPSATPTDPTCAKEGFITVTDPLADVTYSFDDGTSFQSSPISLELQGGKSYQVKVKTIDGGCISPARTIAISPPPSDIGPPSVSPVEFCQSDIPVSLASYVTGTNLLWYTSAVGGVGSSIAPVSDPTIIGNKFYYISQSNGLCESLRATLEVTINEQPIVYAGGPKIYLLKGESVKLKSSVTNKNSTSDPVIKWLPDITINSTSAEQPIVNPTADIKYFMMVTDGGCSAFDTITVFMLEKISIPNIFSPNGDGIHDTWIIDKLEQYSSAQVQIFNRYGQLLYESAGNIIPWDGTYKKKPVPVGAYFYILKLNNTEKPIGGSVSVIR
ncbi:MAG: gliding motility-associated C-terminal domain-containing protein [Bacteroidota bacterium]